MIKQKNSKKQGDVGIGSAVYYLSKNGYTVCIPLSDSQSYDLVVDIDEVLYKVQVKTTTHVAKGNKFQVPLRTNGGNRSGTGVSKKLDTTNVDFLFVLTGNDTNYFIPVDELGGTSNISLSDKYDRFIVK